MNKFIVFIPEASFCCYLRVVNQHAHATIVEITICCGMKGMGISITTILHLLTKLTMVMGLPKMRDEIKSCEACLLGKQHRDTFDKKLLREQSSIYN
jgi:hypothetical protein